MLLNTKKQSRLRQYACTVLEIIFPLAPSITGVSPVSKAMLVTASWIEFDVSHIAETCPVRGSEPKHSSYSSFSGTGSNPTISTRNPCIHVS